MPNCQNIRRAGLVGWFVKRNLDMRWRTTAEAHASEPPRAPNTHSWPGKEIDIKPNESPLVPHRIDERVLAQVFDSAAIGMGLASLDGTWLKVNPALCRIFGYSAEELRSIDFRTFAGQTGADPLSRTPNVERQHVRKDGRPVWIVQNTRLLNGPDGEPAFILIPVQDVSDRKASEARFKLTSSELEAQKEQLVRANRQLLELSRGDPLTGIFNRRVFDERIVGWVTVAHRFDRPLSLLMIDVDQFKLYNDDFGHADGDEALRRIAKQIQLCCRESDVPARYGGEEFGVVCPETARFGALELAERIRRTIRELPLRHRRLTVSVGVAGLHREFDAETLVRNADAALYQAKELGRDRVCCFE
jgi:diguanylate cyclase (GGDEF)-like protein/PAS domain S-box-containing protein